MKRFFLALMIFVFILADTAFAAEYAKADPADFVGKKIGVLVASMQEQWAAEDFKGSEVMHFSTFPDGVLALEDGMVDAFYHADSSARYAIAEKNNLEILQAGEHTMSVAPIFSQNKKGDLLREQYNAYLHEITEDGTLQRYVDKWLDGPEEKRVFDDPSRPKRINGKLEIITLSGVPPLDYRKNGEMAGLEIEVAREFCRRYGYEPVFCDASMDAAIIGVHSGRYSMGVAALTITEERAKSVNFGEPYFTCVGALIVKKNTLAEIAAEDENGNLFLTIRDGLRRTLGEEGRWKLFLSGIRVTLLITVLSVLFGTAAGFGIYLLSRNGNRAVNILVKAINWLVTGMPLVVFLMVLFYIVFARTTLSGTTVAVIGFSVLFSLTMFHLLQSGEEAVSIGQKEAAYALGYRETDAFLRIILPQAAMHFLPAYRREVVALLKATAVVGYITVLDVTKIGDVIRGRTYDAVFPLFAVVAAYFILSAIINAAIRFLQKKVDTKKRKQTAIMKGVEIR